MRTPYPELTRDSNAQLADLLKWNAGIEKARKEYALHPIAACNVWGCDRLVSAPAGALCSSHCSVNVRRAIA